MHEVNGIRIMSYADILESSKQPPTKEEYEANYRRGYQDGYLAAIDHLESIWRLKNRDRIVDILWNHAMKAIQQWRAKRTTDSFEFPPTLHIPEEN